MYVKVLEFVHKNLVKPTGGPNGYVYNLTSIESDDIEYCFLDDYFEPKVKKYKKYFPSILVEIVKAIRENKKIRLIKRGTNIIKNINQFDIIHFHTSNDLYSCKKQLSNFKGKVVLTCHTPIPPFMELYNDYYSKTMRILCGKRSAKKYKKICEGAFLMADYIVYPCKEAEDSYYDLWKGYNDIHKTCENKISYIPTGCVEKKEKYQKEDLFGNIYDGKFLVCYVGRHNRSKGYDILKNIAKKMKTSTNIQFVICGKQGPLYALNSNNWMEIGWTADADSYIKCSDVFILPNRWTYFDLVFLEVLSMGQLIIASNTGGNKYFSNFSNCGIYLYDNIDEAIDYINMIRNMSFEEKELLKKNNRELYLKEFSNNIFSKRYASYYSDVKKNCVKRDY